MGGKMSRQDLKYILQFFTDKICLELKIIIAKNTKKSGEKNTFRIENNNSEKHREV